MDDDYEHPQSQTFRRHETVLEETSDEQPAKKGPAPSTVRDITKQVFDAVGLTYSPDATNLVEMQMPTTGVFETLDPAKFSMGFSKAELEFTPKAAGIGRIGIFSVKKGGDERAVILIVPKGEVPSDVLVCISPNFSQNESFYKTLGGGDPMSPKVIFFTLMRHLVNDNKWASQAIAASKSLAIVYIVRALVGKGLSELGPLGSDGAFFKECLGKMATLTNGSFKANSVSGQSFSLGIFDFNIFITAVSRSIAIKRIINVDPQFATHAVPIKGAKTLEFISGETGFSAGFVFLNPPRWKKEDDFAANEASGTLKTKAGRLAYFHNHCMVSYVPFIALAKS